MSDNVQQRWMDDDLTFAEKYPDGVPLLEMIPFYEMVARNEPLKLEWVCLGKRDPKAEQKSAPVPHSISSTLPKVSESQPDASKLAEFDFDEGTNPSPLHGDIVDANQPLRRVVAPGRHPVRQPRVANMDKILNDLFRTRKETNHLHTSIETSQSLQFNGASATDRVSREQPFVSSGCENLRDVEPHLKSVASENSLDAATPLVTHMNAIAIEGNVATCTLQENSDGDVIMMSDQSLASNMEPAVQDTMFQSDPVRGGAAVNGSWNTTTALDRIVLTESVSSEQTA